MTFGRALFAAAPALLVLSGIAPADRTTWWLEVTPVIAGALVLVATRRRFAWTPLAQLLMFAHAVVLCVGGHWTYAQVPAGDWLRDALGLARNPYDRLGHLMQGFVPAIMSCALVGAVVAQLALARRHDRQLEHLTS